MDLMEIRGKLDTIDRQIVELYEQRMDLCADVAAYKIETGKRVFDKEREQQKLKAVSEFTSNDFNAQGVKELFEQIMSINCSISLLQKMQNQESSHLLRWTR